MIKKVLICFFTAAGLTAPLFPQTIRSYEQTAASPKSVVDFFLLCPEIRLDPENGLMIGEKNSSPDQSASFYNRKLLLTAGKSGNFKINPKVVDIPNGYIRIVVADEAFSSTLTFVIFERGDKSVVPAYSVIDSGPEADSYDCEVFDLRNREWTRYAESQMFPQVKLSELAGNKVSIPSKFAPLVEWEYVLPRKGLIVYLVPRMVDEHAFFHRTGGNDTDLASYADMMKKLSAHAFELKWDISKGRFVKGKAVSWKD